MQIAKDANKTRPKQSLSGCRTFNDDNRTVAIWFFEELDKDAIWYWSRYQSTYVYLDPYTGAVMYAAFLDFQEKYLLFWLVCCVPVYRLQDF